MNGTINAQVRRLNESNFDFLRDRLVTEGEILPRTWLVVEAELKRYFHLVLLGFKPLAMMGPQIDAAWHQLILFTPQYHQFCASVFGFYLHHTPNTVATPVPWAALSNFAVGYTATYGKVPDIWAAGLPKYQQTLVHRLWRAAAAEHMLPAPAQKATQTAAIAAARVLRWSGWAG